MASNSQSVGSRVFVFLLAVLIGWGVLFHTTLGGNIVTLVSGWVGRAGVAMLAHMEKSALPSVSESATSSLQQIRNELPPAPRNQLHLLWHGKPLPSLHLLEPRLGDFQPGSQADRILHGGNIVPPATTQPARP